MYKNKDTGKWMMIYYDFNMDIGHDVIGIEFANSYPNPDKNFPRYTVREWFTVPQHVVDLAIWNNPRFESKLAEVIEDVFNPALLFPHIDELKDFIRPYVLHDKTPDENDSKPGILNFSNTADFSTEQWEANNEFTTVDDPIKRVSGYGLKYWILERYREVCEYYDLECEPTYMDENYGGVVFRNVAVRTVAFRNAALQLLWRPLFFCLQYCGLYFEVYNK